ncbi:hypothetical protein B0T19DRAFT_256136 [Cercophora scortea]|uniref:Uncharacterized protein n=1 Tax=Cercophora scortea TaxID=314031 RepID=A0AAE0I9G5_9PEZI|nr:hypothetical protein B0T19DRAFT_256136 [Cercophora scortea]
MRRDPLLFGLAGASCRGLKKLPRTSLGTLCYCSQPICQRKASPDGGCCGCAARTEIRARALAPDQNFQEKMSPGSSIVFPLTASSTISTDILAPKPTSVTNGFLVTCTLAYVIVSASWPDIGGARQRRRLSKAPCRFLRVENQITTRPKGARLAAAGNSYKRERNPYKPSRKICSSDKTGRTGVL